LPSLATRFLGKVTMMEYITIPLDIEVVEAHRAIKSDAGVQGLPCVGVSKQGRPCTPGII